MAKDALTVAQQDPNAGNSHVTIELSRAQIKRYRNTISGTSCPCSSVLIVIFDWHW